MIEFKGSQKAFFKAYPKDKRSLNEVYCLVSYNIITKQETKTCYQFIGSLGEKNFKKVETPEDVTVTETVTVNTKDTNDTNVSDVQEVDDLEFADPDDDVVEEKKEDVKEKIEEVTEVIEAKVEEKTEAVKEEKPKKKTITSKRKELLDAFDVLSGVIGIEIDADCPVDFFALMNVISEFERGDFSTEPSTYVDMFKYFLNKYPKHAKEIHVCIDYLEEVYNDIRQKKSSYDKHVYNFYSHCGLGAEKEKKEQRKSKSQSKSQRVRKL